MTDPTAATPGASEDKAWKVLIVDDERDVHEVTHLALKRRTWRRRPFELTSCFSGKEAAELLSAPDAPRFQVALVDVVMETQSAGLDLCKLIRSELPASLRIILRTGQPGVAPEEKIINEFDIDYYMAKPEVTPEKLYATVRSCLRSSQDIETLLAFSRQLQQFTSALQRITTDADLLLFMNEGLKFLELKHQVRVTFVKNIDTEAPNPATATPHEVASHAAIVKGHKAGLPQGTMLPASKLGFEDGYGMLFAVDVEGSQQTVRSGFIITQAQAGLTLHTLQNDLSLFMQNWRIAFGAVLLQQRVEREKMLNERMYIERIESIANMVTGVAHEINTPLGVANTANGMIVSLAEEVARTPPGPQLDDVLKDLKEATHLMDKNLDRASKLVRSFKQLSASQLSDERQTCDMASVVQDCIETMRMETKKRKIEVKTNWAAGTQFKWVGFPGHLSQVLINFIQNALRYAYKGEATGPLDVRLFEKGETFVLEFEDYGAGVPPDVFPKMFDPFVTSGREIGGTGLGLAITHNIITNLLKGQVVVTTEVGKGTKFVVTMPKKVPMPTKEDEEKLAKH